MIKKTDTDNLLSFGDRLKYVRKNIKEVKASEIASFLKIRETSYHRYERNESFPSKEILVALSDYFGVNLHWLLTGKGKIFFEETNHDKQDIFNSDFIPVPEISPATCGSSGRIAEDEILGYKAFERKFLKKFKDPVVTRAEGDSMEPLIWSGDLVLIDRNPEYRLRPKNNSIYLVNNPDSSEDIAFTLKRIVLNETKLFLIPQNPIYPIQKIDLHKKNILNVLIGRVEWEGKESE